MPKIKTNRSAAKRFKFSATGKVVYSKSFGSHILTKKTTKRKRSLRKLRTLNGTDSATIHRLLPYG